MCGFGDMMGWMGAWMWANALIGLGVLVLLILGVIAGVRWLVGTRKVGAQGGASDTALEIARQRYARGEINREEFERLREGLS